jgi:energy-coupling factor transporter ATP-binding protein EcfA2
VILAEGIATAWSIASALEDEDAAVVATLSGNNLEAAGRAILEARGDNPPELVIAADLGDGGEPFHLAREAAKHLGAKLAVPTPPEGRDARGWDFDDLRRDRGLDAVRAALEAAPSETAPRAELFKEIPLDELDNAPPPSFLVEHWIPEGEVVLLAAHGGSGKSILSLTLAAHVATGRPFCGLSVQRRKVAFLSFEDHDPILRHRLRRVLAAYGMTPGEVRGNLRVFDASEAGALVTEASAAGARFLTPCEAWGAMEKLDADLVIIDGASDTFDANENERRFVRGFISMLRGLARKRGGAVLLLAHLPKETKAGMNYSGSTAWHNSVRARLSMTRDDNGLVTVSQEKSNHGPCAGAKVFTFADGGVLVPTEPGEVAAVKGTAPGLIDEAVLEAIREAYQNGNPISTADRGPNNAAKALQDLLRGKWNTIRHNQISPALTRLAVSGKIRRAEWVTPGRKRREVWAPADAASPSPEAANPPDDDGAPVAPVALVSPLIPPMPETGASGAPGSGGKEGLRQFPENQKPAQLAQLEQAPGEAAAASDLALEEGDLLALEDDELIL